MVELSPERLDVFRDPCREAKEGPLTNVVDRVGAKLGPGPHGNFNRFMAEVEADADARGVKPTAKRKTLLKTSLDCRDETAEPVIKKVHRTGTAESDPLRGLYQAAIDGKPAVLEYEPNADLRDTEQIPLLYEGGIEAFLSVEVLL